MLSKVRVDETQLFAAKEKEFLSKQEKSGSAGVWTLTSPDGEGGHVGTVLCEVAFVVVPPAGGSGQGDLGDIIAVYRAKVLDKPATALNLTQHWVFNVGASGVAKGKPTPAEDISIADHVLELKSKHILNLDPVTSLPTGTALPLSSVPQKDFHQKGGKTIGHAGKGYPTASTASDKMGQGYPGEGYDEFWVFDRAPKNDITVPEATKEDLNVFADIQRE